jgi:multidrug efflux pump subunit AcrA (membrane-fusion protein)
MKFKNETVAILWTIMVLILSCRESNQVVQPEKRDITEAVYASGMVKSNEQYYVYPETAGIINRIFKKEGDTIVAGEALLEQKNDLSKIDRDNAQLASHYNNMVDNPERINELKYSYESAERKMINDSLMYVRQKKLFSQGVGSLVELEQRELAYQTSKTLWQSAAMRYRDMEKQLTLLQKQSQNNLMKSTSLFSDYILKSKINGKVYSILNDPGEYISPQKPVAVIGQSDFYLELSVDEYDIEKVDTGQVVLVNLDSYADTVFEAKVSRIIPVMNDKTKTFLVEAMWVQQPKQLFPFMTAEANIIVSRHKNVLTIPRNCLIKDRYVILENGDTTLVETGLKDYQYVEIKSGINASSRLKIPQL